MNNEEDERHSFLVHDPYSYFASKFFSAFDRIMTYNGGMSDHEWWILQQVRRKFIDLDPDVEGVRREKT